MSDSKTGGSERYIQSAHIGNNAELFPKVLELHVGEGASIADITYGQGVFWKGIPDDKYELYGTDIDPQKSPNGESVDFRSLPYDNNNFDAVVFDPPYSSGFFKETNAKGTGKNDYAQFRTAYTSDHTSWSGSIHPEASKARKRHARVLDLYYRGGEEAYRVLKQDGILIVKTQDEVSDNLNYMTHVEIINYYESIGFTTKDLFILVKPNRATTPNNNQHTALKNHSYFIVFDMAGGSLRG